MGLLLQPRWVPHALIFYGVTDGCCCHQRAGSRYPPACAARHRGGGYTGLVLAGAKPDVVHPQFACVNLRSPLCQDLHERRIPPMVYPPDARTKAYVLADPLSAFPSRTSVYSVRAPVQLWA